MQQATLSCRIDGCDSPTRAKGMCRSHYRKSIVRPATCEACGGTYQRRPDSSGKYCSDCRADAWSASAAAAAQRVIEQRWAEAPPACKVTYAPCQRCTRVFVKRAGALWCGAECRREYRRASKIAAYRAKRECPDCGGALPKDQQRCQPCAEVHNAESYKRSRAAFLRSPAGKAMRTRARHKRRARMHRVAYESFNTQEIYERDGWRCGVCQGEVNQDLKFPDPGSASLDHVIPLAKGGAHVRTNVQLAHFLCNSLKSDSVGGEPLHLGGPNQSPGPGGRRVPPVLD